MQKNRKQNFLHKKKNQPVETDPQLVEQADKDSKIAIVNILHFSEGRKKHDHNKKNIEEIKEKQMQILEIKKYNI